MSLQETAPTEDEMRAALETEKRREEKDAQRAEQMRAEGAGSDTGEGVPEDVVQQWRDEVKETEAKLLRLLRAGDDNMEK